MNKPILLIVAGLVSLLALAAACGGGSSDNSKAPAATKAPAAATPAAEQAAPASNADLVADVSTMRTVMNNTIAKAQAGDVQGTRDAEGAGDKAMEALIKGIKATDAASSSALEKLELDYEHQADSDNTDLAVMTKDAQDVLKLLDTVGSELGAASNSSGGNANLVSDISTMRTVMQNTAAKAQAGDVQGCRDAEGAGDTAMEDLIKGLKTKDASLSAQLEQLELDYEHQADADNTDLSVMTKDAQQVLSLLDKASSEVGS